MRSKRALVLVSVVAGIVASSKPSFADDRNVSPSEAVSPRQCQRAWDSYNRCLGDPKSATYAKSTNQSKDEYCYSRSNRFSLCTRKLEPRDRPPKPKPQPQPGGGTPSTTSAPTSTYTPTGATPPPQPPPQGPTNIYTAIGGGLGNLVGLLFFVGGDDGPDCVDDEALLSHFGPLLVGFSSTLIPFALRRHVASLKTLRHDTWLGWGEYFDHHISVQSTFGVLNGSHNTPTGEQGRIGTTSEILLRMSYARVGFSYTSGLTMGGETHDIADLRLSIGGQLGHGGLLSPFMDLGFNLSWMYDCVPIERDSATLRIGNASYIPFNTDKHDNNMAFVFEIAFITSLFGDSSSFGFDGMLFTFGLSSMLF